jgi:hypothetical protein
MKWSVHPTNGTITVSRDAGSGPNRVANVYQSGYWGHDELALSNTPTGNIVFVVTQGMLEVGIKKDCTYNVDTQNL